MHISTLLTTLAAAAAASATLSTSKAIKLVANVTNFDLTPSLQSYELATIPINASDPDNCAYVARLSPPGTGSLWYGKSAPTVNTAVVGPGGRIAFAGIQATKGGTATVPAAWPVGVRCATGTDGVDVVAGGAGVPVLSYDNGGWQACPASVLPTHASSDDDTIVIGYVADGQRVYYGCAKVAFEAVCAEGFTEWNAVDVPCVVAE